MDSTGPGQSPAVVPCKHSNEPSGSTKQELLF